MKIKILFNKIRNSLFITKIFNCSLLFLISFYFFSKIIFDRPVYTTIQNTALMAIFLLSAIKFVLYREYHNFKILIPILIVLILALISNLFSLTFSYDFIILFLIMCSSYFLAKSFNNKYKWEIIIGTYVVGFTLGMIVILFEYRNTLFSSTALGFDQRFLNLDGLGFSLASLSCLSFVLGILVLKKRKNFISIVCFINASIAFLSSCKTYRIGCIVFMILFYAILIMWFIYKKNKIVFLITLISLIIALCLVIFIPSKNTIINRFKSSLFQPFHMDLILDESTRERTFLLISNIVISIMCPIIGIGCNNYFDISNTGSHNAFGSVSINYGLLCLVIIMVIIFRIFKKYKNGGGISKHIFIYYFLLHTIFSFFYGTAFESRTYYFIFGSALFYAFNEISFKRIDKNADYWVRI